MRKSPEVRNLVCDTIVNLVDQGTLYASGRLNIYNTDSTLITFLEFSNPAFRDATDGTSVTNFIYDATSFMDGTAVFYEIVNRDATMIWDGTVTDRSGNGDVKFDTLIFPKDTTVSLLSTVYIVPE